MILAVLLAMATVAMRAGLHSSNTPVQSQELFGQVTDHLIGYAGQVAHPVKCAAAGFHANQAGLQLRKERQELCPSKRHVDHNLRSRGDPMDLENTLRQVDANCGNLHGVARLICRL
jgi:hypothetical protein